MAELIENGPLAFLEANTLGPLMSPGAKAGVVGRWMSLGHYDLALEQALVIRIPPTGAPYQGSQLADLWFGSLEYASATSSITAEQAHHAPDGFQYLVVSLEDPGYANWLDPAGVAKGIVQLRFDGLDDQPSEAPTAELVSVGELPNAIPDFDAGRIGADARAAQRAERRRHVQVRYGR